MHRTFKMRSISVTGHMTFRECRRRWYFEYLEGLTSKTPSIDLWLGIGIHEALAKYYENSRDLKLAIETFQKYYDKSQETMAEGYGLLWDQGAREEVWQTFTKGLSVLERYHRYSEPLDQQWTIMAVEQTVDAPVLTGTLHTHRVNGKVSPQKSAGAPPFRGRIDLLVREKSSGLIFVVDHKVYKTSPTLRGLDLDDQFTGYLYLAKRRFDYPVRGVIINVLVNRAPSVPKQLKDGSLSRDLSQSVDYESYLGEIHRLGLKPESYTDVLTKLQERGWQGYFHRELTTRNDLALASFEKRVHRELRDMKECETDFAHAYPNLTQYCEFRCPFHRLCLGIEDGSDVAWLKENSFTKYVPRETTPDTHGGGQG